MPASPAPSTRRCEARRWTPPWSRCPTRPRCATAGSRCGRPAATKRSSRRAGWRVVMAAAFKNEGDGTLSVDIRRRTTPVADRTTAIAGTAMTRRRHGRGPARRPAARGRLVAPAVRPRSPAAALLVAGGWRPGARRGADLPARRHHHGAVLHGHSGADRGHHRVEGDAAPPGRELALDARAHHQVEDPRPASPPRGGRDEGRQYAPTSNTSSAWATASSAARASAWARSPPPASKRRSTTITWAPRCPSTTIRRIPGTPCLEREPPLPLAWLYAIAAGVLVVGLAIVAVFWNVSAILRGAGGIFPGEGLPAGPGLLHPGRTHDAGHAVGIAAPGRRGFGAGRKPAAVSSPAPSSTIASGSVAPGRARW